MILEELWKYARGWDLTWSGYDPEMRLYGGEEMEIGQGPAAAEKERFHPVLNLFELYDV